MTEFFSRSAEIGIRTLIDIFTFSVLILFHFVFDKFYIKFNYVVYRPSCGVIIQIKLLFIGSTYL